jgi:hypothetical protein
MATAVPPNVNTNGMGSSPSSSNNMHTSPINKPPNPGNVSETKPFIPMQNFHYVVKIDELSFDSRLANKLIDFGNMPPHWPKEPDNVYGVPRLTMRMIEFCEGTQALEPMIDFLELTQSINVLRTSSF